MGRKWTLLVAVWAVTACSLVQTPCDRVASSICGIAGEEESCRFLKGAKSGNEALQQACTELEPAARSYAASPGSLLEKGRWLGARLALSAVGFVGDVTARKPADKLEAAGQRLEEAGSKVREGIEEAGEALKDAVRDAAR